MHDVRKAEATEWQWLAARFRPHLRLHLRAMAVLLTATLLSLVDPLILKWLVDDGLPSVQWQSVMTAVTLFCILYGARLVLVKRGSLMMNFVAEQVTLRMRRLLMRRVHSLDRRFLDRTSIGELARHIEQDALQVAQAGASLLPATGRIVVSVVMIVIVMWRLDWRLSSIVVPFVLALLGIQVGWRRRLEKAADSAREAQGRASGFLHDCLAGVSQTQGLGAQKFMCRQYVRLAARSAHRGLEQRRVELTYIVVSGLALTAATATILLVGAFEVWHQRLTIGSYIAFYTYLLRLFEPLNSAVDAYTALKRSGGSIRRILEIEATEPSVRDESTVAWHEASAGLTLGCRNLVFGYDDGKRVLRCVNLEARPGARIAVVGTSGAGKSTLAKVLARFYSPDGGQVLIGGVDARLLPLRGLRKAVALVPHQPSLFQGTIRENVLLGRSLDCAMTLDRLARVACVDSVVAGTPEGWETMLGPGGAGLSDGERQRVGLLRALIRCPQVLILDEATGALDPEIEARLLERLGAHMSGGVVLVITHRSGVTRWAEETVVLREGSLWPVSKPSASSFGAR